MCGIAGIVTFDNRPVRREDLGAMCAEMTHRGPDDAGFHFGPGVGLGMRRLSIIDLSNGHQPIANEDESVWAVLNGEIYNYRELRQDLEARGHVFRTFSDTETIVHLYEEHGLHCVDRLRGMFGFAVWDARQRKLLVARDRLGIKPLYYTFNGRRLAFASELKSLLTLRDVDVEIDPSAVNHLLTFLTTPSDRSIVRSIRKLEPGHLLHVEPGCGEPLVQSYWDVRFEPDQRAGVEELTEELKSLLEESTRLHMISDVPVGAFLSGGVDSSTVVAMMARQSSRPVKTFSVGFQEEDFDELRWARQVAVAFGTDHHETILEPDVLPSLEDIIWHLDEPFGDSSAIPTYVVSKLASTQVKVVLSGDGGDELFGGYDRYLVEQRERRFDVLPESARTLLMRASAALPPGARGKNFLRHRALAGHDRYLDAATLFSSSERALLMQPHVLRQLHLDDPVRAASRRLDRSPHWLSSLQELDLKSYLPLDILTKVDRMSMAHSIEARVPLLDHRVVELAARVPPELLVRGGTTKYLLKRAMRGILPEPILTRKKQGFAVPLGRWFRGRLRDTARDLLLCDTSRQRGIFRPEAVAQLLEHKGRGRDMDLQTWTLLSFELWCRLFLDAGNRTTVSRDFLSASA
jgi:asparagine synthase (glutamine-hydrolysing)